MDTFIQQFGKLQLINVDKFIYQFGQIYWLMLTIFFLLPNSQLKAGRKLKLKSAHGWNFSFNRVTIKFSISVVSYLVLIGFSFIKQLYGEPRETYETCEICETNEPGEIFETSGPSEHASSDAFFEKCIFAGLMRCLCFHKTPP